MRQASRLHFSRSGVVVLGLAVVMTAALLVATTADSKAETTGPAITHVPVATAFYGQAIPISVRTSCTSGCAARLYYRATAPAALLAVPGLVGEGGFQVAGLANVTTGPDTTEWRGEIPGYVVTTTGLDYYVEVDQNGATTKYPGTPMAGGVQPLGIYFHVNVLSPPLINHVPVPFGFAGQPLNIDAQATCASGNCQGTVYYRTPGLLSTDYNSVGMTQTSATPLSSAGSLLTLTGQVPGSAIDTRGLDYYIGVRDGATTTYLPGTTYEGYYAPRDGAPSTNTPYHVHVVEPPRIVHAPVASAPFGQDIAITATSPCPSGRSCQGTLYYRTTTSNILGPAGFGATSMAVTRPASVAGLDTILLSGTIPGGAVDTRGVDYYFSVSDGTTTAWWPGTPPVDAPTLWMDGLGQGLYHHVHVQEPVHIAPAQPPMAAPHQDLTLLAEITCSTPSCHAELHYSGQPLLPGGTFQTVSMTRTAVGQASTPASRVETWSATIPASQVTTRGLAYYVTAGDGYTNTASPGTSYWGAYVPVDGMTAAPDVATYVVRVVDPPHPQLVPVGPAFTGEPKPLTVASNCASPSCTATLYWQVAGPGVLGQWQSAGMTQLSRTPLAYGNDLVTYSGAIPGQPSGTALVYRVEVSDGDSTDTTPSWPLAVSDRPAPTPTTEVPTTVPPPPITAPPATVPPVSTPPASVPPGPATTVPPPPATLPPATVPPVATTQVTVPPPPATLPPATVPPVSTTAVTIPPVSTTQVTIPPPPATLPPGTIPPVSTTSVTIPPVSTTAVTIPAPPVTVPSIGQPVTDALVSCAQMGGDVGLANIDDLVQALQDLTPAQAAGFAGAYIAFDQLVHVGVVGAAAQAALPSSLTNDPRVKVEQLKFTTNQLEGVLASVASRLNNLLGSSAPAPSTWPYKGFINPFCNTVDIQLDPSALPRLDAIVQDLGPWLLDGSARITGVEPVIQADASCISVEDCWPARAGIMLKDGNVAPTCTLGWITRDAQGRREALTADHCLDRDWYAGGKSAGRRQWTSPAPYTTGVDAQTLSLNNEDVPTPSNTLKKGTDDYGYVPRKITAPSQSLHGRKIWSAGAFGGNVQGKLTSWSATVKGQPGYARWQGDGGSALCHGDSGGPVYDTYEGSNRAYGINTNIDAPEMNYYNCGGGTQYFTWTAKIEAASGRKILNTVTTEALGPGQALFPGHVAYLRSSDAEYVLIMQGDGNLVLENQAGQVLWHTLQYPSYVRVPGAHAVMQGDGNFIVYSPDGAARWDSDAHRIPGYPKVAGSYVTIQTDGNLVVYAPNGTARYSRFNA